MVDESRENESKGDQGRGRGERRRVSANEGFEEEEECRNREISQELWTTSELLRKEGITISKRRQLWLRRFDTLEIARRSTSLNNCIFKLRGEMGERLARERKEIERGQS